MIQLKDKNSCCSRIPERKIIEAVIIERKDEILERLKCDKILFSRDQICTRITNFSVESVDALSSNQEEADTKLLLHAREFLENSTDALVLVRSPSGDIDLNVLFVNMFQAESERMYIDFGTGKSRKIFKLSSIDMNEELKSALLGFHAFTGNDYVSSIFGKSNKICWKAVTKSSIYARIFNRLGETVNSDENSITLLEEFVCSLYRKNKKDINELRYEIFQTMYEKKGRIQDLSLLPPCRSSLQLHCKRSNYVARIWRSILSCNIDPDNIQNHGWSENGDIIWIEEAFPENIESILVNDEISDEDEDEIEEAEEAMSESDNDL